MSKEEFLSELRDSLSTKIPNVEVEENIRYYSGYIDEEIRKGKTLNQVMVELGDPRLIARTIVETTSYSNENVYEDYQSSNTRKQTAYEDYSNTQQEDEFNHSSHRGSIHISNSIPLFYKVIGIIFIIVVLFAVVSISGLVISFLIRFGLPILLVLLLYNIIRRH